MGERNYLTKRLKPDKITYKQKERIKKNLSYPIIVGDEMIKLNLITMKDGKINVEEKKDLSEMLSNSIEEATQNHVDEVFKSRTVKSKLPKGFYLNEQNSEFFTGTLESMVHTITDESKKWKIEKRLKEGNFFGTFRRFKTTQSLLVKAYKTRKGAENNTFWRNH